MFFRADPHAFARKGQVAKLQKALDRDLKAAILPNAEGETPVHVAARHGQLEALRLLLDRGARPGVRTPTYETPLHTAAAAGHEAAVRLLLERGAKPGAVDKAGVTPTGAARAAGQNAIAAILREAGAIDPGFGDLVDFPHDDELLVLARSRARKTVPLMVDLLMEHPDSTLVEVPFAAGEERVKHVWCHLIGFDGQKLKARICHGPDETFEAPLKYMGDWRVDLDDGRIRGGFTHQAMLLRLLEVNGKLPPGLQSQAARFVDQVVT